MALITFLSALGLRTVVTEGHLVEAVRTGSEAAVAGYIVVEVEVGCFVVEVEVGYIVAEVEVARIAVGVAVVVGIWVGWVHYIVEKLLVFEHRVLRTDYFGPVSADLPCTG